MEDEERIGDPEDSGETSSDPDHGHRDRIIKVTKQPYSRDGSEFVDQEGPIRQTSDADARIDLQQYTFRRKKGESWDA